MRLFRRAIPLALVFLTLASAGASAQGQKIGYIRSTAILDQAPGREAAQAQFEKDAQVYQAEMKRMSDSLDAMVAAFQKSQASMTASARDAKQKELQSRNAEYQRRSADLQQKAQQRQGELVQPILDKVKAAIEDVRVEGGYSFILNADEGSAIVAMDKNLDLTDRVLAKLRAGAGTAAKPATPAPAGAPSGVTRPQNPPVI
ncbi:MAG TPA: OmpH family outer membrane protein [Gemmatimonadaceae bacterium]|nr:OmpH family outer membrane protein [Gemmatimonadaceae bacterium]